MTIIGYADDLALVVVAKDRTHIENATNKTTQIIKKGLNKAGLEMVTEKTKAVILEEQRKMTEAIIRIRDEEIHTIEKVKYLELVFRRNCNFAGHIEAVTSGGERKSLVNRLLPSVGGARASVRRPLMSVTYSIVLYAAPIWGKAIEITRNMDRLRSRLQRMMALRVSAGYRTTSTDALLGGSGNVSNGIDNRREGKKS